MATLTQINQFSPAEFSSAFGAVYEQSPWIAGRAFALKPAIGFASRAAVHAALLATVQSASEDEKLKLLNSHPELAGKDAASGTLTSESTSEQAGAGLTAMTAALVAQLREHNAAYREKFGFPFIIAVREHTKTEIFSEFERRLENDAETEIETCFAQVFAITRLRLEGLIH